jgi:hypothetical protein
MRALERGPIRPSVLCSLFGISSHFALIPFLSLAEALISRRSLSSPLPKLSFRVHPFPLPCRSSHFAPIPFLSLANISSHFAPIPGCAPTGGPADRRREISICRICILASDNRNSTTQNAWDWRRTDRRTDGRTDGQTAGDFNLQDSHSCFRQSEFYD